MRRSSKTRSLLHAAALIATGYILGTLTAFKWASSWHKDAGEPPASSATMATVPLPPKLHSHVNGDSVDRADGENVDAEWRGFEIEPADVLVITPSDSTSSSNPSETHVPVPTLAHVQRLIDCWCANGDWVKSVELAHDRCMLNSEPCFGLAPNDRINELAYQWQPRESECKEMIAEPGFTYQPLSSNVRQFYSLLQHKRILVAGDSFQRRMYNGLMDKLACYLPSISQISSLFLGRAYRLETRQGPNVTQLDLIRKLARSQFDIFIINRGVHYTPTRILQEELAKTLDDLFANNPHAYIIFRSTCIGHDTCEHYRNHVPLSEPEAAALRNTTFLGLGSRYHWNEIWLQNDIVRQFLHARCPHRCLFIPVHELTYRRADSHFMSPNGSTNRTDCLHYCSPGPMDMWMDMLVNTILYMAHAKLLDNHV